jgi:hydrogenase/urease accessory protein HupE
MSANAVGYAYGAGFMLATVGLQACGIGTADLLQPVKVPVVRWAGAAIAVAGVCLWVF